MIPRLLFQFSVRNLKFLTKMEFVEVKGFTKVLIKIITKFSTQHVDTYF